MSTSQSNPLLGLRVKQHGLLYFKYFFSNVEFWWWHKSISVARWTVFPSFCAFSTLSCLLLTYSGSCIGYLHCLRDRSGFLDKFVFSYRNIPSVSNVMFMIFVLSLLNALSGRFASLAKKHARTILFSLCGLRWESLVHPFSRSLECGIIVIHELRFYARKTLLKLLLWRYVWRLYAATCMADSKCDSNFLPAFFVISSIFLAL